MSRIRVVRLVPELDFGGVESRLILQAATHDPAEIDLHVCTMWKAGAAASAIRRAGVPTHVIGSPPAHRSRTIARLVSHLRNCRPDVLHCSVAEANVIGLAAGLVAGVPVRIAEEVGMPSHGMRARLGFRALYSTATAVVGVTQAVCDYLVDVDCAPRSIVRRIYNCAHPRFFPHQRPALVRTDEQRNTLVLVGRLHPVKNHETIFRAFARVLREHPSARLTVVGDGPLRNQLETLSRTLRIEGAVSMLGFREDVANELAESGAFVLGSHAEGCSISLIEAMATGLPALGSRVPGIAEVLGPTLANTWTAPATDEEGWAGMMQRYLATSAEERIELAASCQERAYSNFSPSRYIADLRGMYTELTQEAGRSVGRDRA